MRCPLASPASVTPPASSASGTPSSPTGSASSSDVTGITLLTTRPDGTVTLTPDGEQFALTVRPVLESLAQSRSQDASYAP
ncbi:MAG: hypothetical protein ACHP9Z_28365 [Streptosporangiales bacterium]